MSVALHAEDPRQVYCPTRGGQVLGAPDGGRCWHEYPLPDGSRTSTRSRAAERDDGSQSGRRSLAAASSTDGGMVVSL